LGSAREFFADLNVNYIMKEEVLRLRNGFDDEGLTEEEKLDFVKFEIIPLARRYGYDFTMEDYLELLEEEEKINQESLNYIRGGKFSQKSLAVATGLNLVSFDIEKENKDTEI
jgi:hypothetical protein